jgi:hypothetical protein
MFKHRIFNTDIIVSKNVTVSRFHKSNILTAITQLENDSIYLIRKTDTTITFAEARVKAPARIFKLVVHSSFTPKLFALVATAFAFSYVAKIDDVFYPVILTFDADAVELLLNHGFIEITLPEHPALLDDVISNENE